MPDESDDPSQAELNAHVHDERLRMEHSNRLFQANREQYEMAEANIATMYFVRYEALAKAGFTKEEAMQLLLTFGIED